MNFLMLAQLFRIILEQVVVFTCVDIIEKMERMFIPTREAIHIAVKNLLAIPGISAIFLLPERRECGCSLRLRKSS